MCVVDMPEGGTRKLWDAPAWAALKKSSSLSLSMYSTCAVWCQKTPEPLTVNLKMNFVVQEYFQFPSRISFVLVRQNRRYASNYSRRRFLITDDAKKLVECALLKSRLGFISTWAAGCLRKMYSWSSPWGANKHAWLYAHKDTLNFCERINLHWIE